MCFLEFLCGWEVCLRRKLGCVSDSIVLTEVCRIIAEKRHPCRKLVAGGSSFAWLCGMTMLFSSLELKEVFGFLTATVWDTHKNNNNSSSYFFRLLHLHVLAALQVANKSGAMDCSGLYVGMGLFIFSLHHGWCLLHLHFKKQLCKTSKRCVRGKAIDFEKFSQAVLLSIYLCGLRAGSLKSSCL